MNIALRKRLILLAAALVLSATGQAQADVDMGGNAINNVATIALNTVVVYGDACPTNGMIARNAVGAVMSCQSGIWKNQQSLYWQDPVTNFASLPACDAPSTWQTRVVQTPSTGSGPRAYTCDGTAWQPLGVDDNGNISVAGTATINALAGNLQLTTTVTYGDACPTNGMIARNAVGAVMSCQGGVWKNQQSLYWQDPVTNFASLPACNTPSTWQTRVVQTPTTGSGPRAYTCDGTTWQPLGGDDNGNVTIAGTAIINALAGNLQIISTATEGAACTPDGRIAMSSAVSGLLLTCQSGSWRRDPGTVCGAGQAYIGGSCQAVSAYAPPSGTYILGGALSGCPSGYTQVPLGAWISDNYGTTYAICRKN